MNSSLRESSAPGRRALGGRSRAALAALTLVLLLPGRPAKAQTVIAADGTLNLNYTMTTPHTPGTGALETEIRPSVVFQMRSPRFVWSASYRFTGSLTLNSQYTNSYSNLLVLTATSVLTERSTLDLSGSLHQGDVAFQLTEAAPDAGNPTFRPQGNPNFVTAILREGLSWQVSPEFGLGQGITGTLVAPQYSLDEYSASLAGFLRLNRAFQTNALGAAWLPTASLLRGAGDGGEPFWTVTNALEASWNHDFDSGWNGQLSAGVAHVISFVGENPSSVVPTGSLTARYFSGSTSGALALAYGPYTNLSTGTVSQSGSVTARGSVSFDPLVPRHLAASVGFRRSRPLGAVAPGSLAGLGDALQGDVGFVWALTPALRASARASVAYQFNQPGGVANSLVEVFLVGLTYYYSNAASMPPMPTPGQRVDGADAVGLDIRSP